MGYVWHNPTEIVIVGSPTGTGVQDARLDFYPRHRYRILHAQINNDNTTDAEQALITFFNKVNPNTDVDLFLRLAEGHAKKRCGLHFDVPFEFDGPGSLIGQVNHLTSISHFLRVLLEMVY